MKSLPDPYTLPETHFLLEVLHVPRPLPDFGARGRDISLLCSILPPLSSYPTTPTWVVAPWRFSVLKILSLPLTKISKWSPGYSQQAVYLSIRQDHHRNYYGFLFTNMATVFTFVLSNAMTSHENAFISSLIPRPHPRLSVTWYGLEIARVHHSLFRVWSSRQKRRAQVH